MKKIGLVLAGGGGKGAYQIGVWKALRETGFEKQISAVSGTSVGGLNAALFVQGDYDLAEYIWRTISKEQILSPHHPLKNFITKGHPFPNSFFTREGIHQIIDTHLNLHLFDESYINCYLSCYKIKEKSQTRNAIHTASSKEQKNRFQHIDLAEYDIESETTYFNMKNHTIENRKNILLATSALPFIFPKVKIKDSYYIDGSIKDNTPILPLYREEGCTVIIVVHLKRGGDWIDKNLYPNTRILEIVPQENLGGTLDFDPIYTEKKILQGYQESIDLFRHWKELIKAEQLQSQKRMEQLKQNRQYEQKKNEQKETFNQLFYKLKK